MAPKGKRGGSAAKTKSGEEEREEPLQAVVLADSYETRFLPFTLERPRCLLTLANTPLLEYTLEFLANAGVEEIFLYCGNHADAVEEYLKTSKWMQPTSPFSLELIRSTSRSIGDAMRDLDQKQLITGDFICVYGDVIANVPLEDALTAHRMRREKDKKSIMTMVLRAAGDSHRTKSQYVRPCFVIDPAVDRCVHYEQLIASESPTLDIPDEVVKESTELEIREDLIDCGIDICTPEVLAQYSDNFDWQMPRRGFLNGVLKDYETLQLSIHTHILAGGYAARVKNLRAYDAISKDVLSRWTYPLCPDVNLLPDQTFQLQKGPVYKEDGVVLARSSAVNRRVVLGKDSSVGEGTIITNSVIGRRCVIGRNVRIEGAYIWDDARIGDKTVIDRAIIANEASIGKRCTIPAGVLVAHGVSIANDITLAANQRVTRLKRKRGYENDELVRGETDVSLVGKGGDGFLLDLDDEEEELVEAMLVSGEMDGDITSDSISVLDSDEEEEPVDVHFRRSSRSESFASIGSDESGDARHRAADFHHEAVASLFDALGKKEEPETIQLELRALSLASNAEGKQIRRAVAVAFNKRIASLIEAGSSPKDAVTATIPPNKQLVKGCVGMDDDNEQAEFLLYLQTDLVHRSQGEKVLLFASNALATSDLVEAEGFERWWNDPRSSATDELQRVRAETKQLVDVLIDDDDDDGDDGDDDDDNSESE